jgi:hypothetical protein
LYQRRIIHSLEGRYLWCRILDPLTATILYALLDDILNRARSPAYGHAARYLEKLDALAAHGDAASSIDPHHAYRAALSQKHGRKSGFWSLVKVRK